MSMKMPVATNRFVNLLFPSHHILCYLDGIIVNELPRINSTEKYLFNRTTMNNMKTNLCTNNLVFLKKKKKQSK